ncbi:hypothetical protein ACFLWO_01795 [Chloroflexota bacterium]
MDNNNTNYNRLPPKVPPIAHGRVYGDTIMVICPHCAKTHRHGYREGVYPAHRVSHCHQEKAAAGYLVVIV